MRGFHPLYFLMESFLFSNLIQAQPRDNQGGGKDGKFDNHGAELTKR